MSKIRKSAAGKDCLARLPGVCNFNPETTVAAHVRIAGLCGIGAKPSDVLTIRACSSCHDEIDHRTHKIYAPDLDRYILEALARTLVEYVREGLIKQ